MEERHCISLQLVKQHQWIQHNSTKQIELRQILRGFLTQNTHLLTSPTKVVPCRCIVRMYVWYQRISAAMFVYVSHSMLKRLCRIDSRWAGIPVKWAKVHGHQFESSWIQLNHTSYLIHCSCFTKLGKLFHAKYIWNHYKHQTSSWTSWKPPWPYMNLDQLSLHKFAPFLLCGFWVPNPMLAKCRSASLARPSELLL